MSRRKELRWPNGMVSHRVRLGSPEEVDGEVEAWIKRAWEAA